ncbi:MAG: hypothetical protein AAF328_08690, partial [Planctomycetota bacterium]
MLIRQTLVVSALASSAGLAPAALGQVIFQEDFNGKTQSQFNSEWANGDGLALIADPSDPNATDIFPDLPDTAVFHATGAVVTWNGLNDANGISPTADKSIKVSVDQWDDAAGNKRMSLGLRGSADPLSII